MTKKQKIEKLLTEAVKNNNADNVISRNSHTVSISEVEDGSNAKIIGFDRRKKKYDLRTNIVEWTNRDFAIYMKHKYYERYKENWDSNVINITVYIDKIKDEVENIYGHCDNIIMRDYIVFFFDRWADYFKNKNKNKLLYKKNFKSEDVLKDFVEHYDYKGSVDKILNKEKEFCTEDKFNNEVMEKSYLLGDSNFVLEYGIILSVNWLILIRGYGLKDAVNYVANAFYKLYKKKVAKKVLSNTKNFCPYPNWFIFKNYDIIIEVLNKKVNDNMSLTINFVKDVKKFNFLRRSI